MEAVPQGRPLRVWEAEVMLRAAAWILIWRGLAFGVGWVLGTAAQDQYGAHSWRWWDWAAVPSVVLAAAGMGLLNRMRPARWVLLPLVVAWVLLVVSPLVTTHIAAARAWDSFDIAKDFLLLAILPAFFLPDLFALYAAFRRDGREALQPDQPPLASVASAWRVRATGRVLVATGMVALAVLSAAICLLGLPGLMIA